MVFHQQIVKKNSGSMQTVVAISFALVVYGISSGINLTGFALYLDSMDFSKIQIGKILAMELAGNLVIAPLFPRLLSFLGVIKTIVLMLLLRALCLITIFSSVSVTAYMAWLFVFGITGFSLFAAIQYWGARISQVRDRATTLSIFNVSFGIGIALGIWYLMSFSDHISSELFYTSALVSLLIILPILFIYKNAPDSESDRHSVVMTSKLINHALIPILCGMVANYILLSLSNFIVLYAIDHGLQYSSAVGINIYLIAGNILLTIPIGIIVDKVDNIKSLIVMLIVIIISVLFIPFVISNQILSILIFVIISGATGGVYIIGLSMISERFFGADLTMASTVMLMMNAIGGFSGVSATGAALEYWGREGIILSISVFVFFFLLFVIYSLNNEKENI
ncbi:MAG: hypothetical protein RLZZ59_394 [Pseudomonadota bacterium]|jgi:predicted MFS family arabinose efflux permease